MLEHEDSHDHYLLGKVDMAQEILEEINNSKGNYDKI